MGRTNTTTILLERTITTAKYIGYANGLLWTPLQVQRPGTRSARRSLPRILLKGRRCSHQWFKVTSVASSSLDPPHPAGQVFWADWHCPVKNQRKPANCSFSGKWPTAAHGADAHAPGITAPPPLWRIILSTLEARLCANGKWLNTLPHLSHGPYTIALSTHHHGPTSRNFPIYREEKKRKKARRAVDTVRKLSCLDDFCHERPSNGLGGGSSAFGTILRRWQASGRRTSTLKRLSTMLRGTCDFK